MPAELYGDRDFCLDHHEPELERLRVEVERLANQTHARGQFADDYQQRAEHAEAEVVRLRADADERAEAHQREIDWYEPHLQRAQADIDRLRAALRHLLEAGYRGREDFDAEAERAESVLNQSQGTLS